VSALEMSARDHMQMIAAVQPLRRRGDQQT